MATQQTAIVNQEQNAIEKAEKFSEYIRRPEVVEKFSLVLGKNDTAAMRYVQSVILLYETAEPGDYSLRNCTHSSLVKAALRAATQRVSVDPADREAHLVPRNNGKTGKQEACFQFHYQEIYNRAMRTGRYTVINVSPIYEGTEIFENVYTGLHVLKMDNGLTISNESAPVLRKWGQDAGKERIGWLGYYRTTRGAEKTVYMAIADIDRQVHLAPGGGMGFGWKKFRETMERKTVLLALLRQADLKAPEMTAVKTAMEEIDNAEGDDIVDSGPDLAELETLEGNAEPVDEPEPVKQATQAPQKAQEAPSAARPTNTVTGQFNAIWNRAQAAKLLTAENVKVWSMRAGDGDEAILGKIALIEAAIESKATPKRQPTIEEIYGSE